MKWLIFAKPCMPLVVLETELLLALTSKSQVLTKTAREIDIELPETTLAWAD